MGNIWAALLDYGGSEICWQPCQEGKVVTVSTTTFVCAGPLRNLSGNSNKISLDTANQRRPS